MSDNKIMRSAKLVSGCTGLSRILGFVRTVLMAHIFGTSLASSAFVFAFTIPNMFRRLFGEGALSAAFIPVYTETLEKDGVEEANKLAGKVMTMLFVALGTLALGTVLLISVSINCFHLNEKAAMVLPLLRIMFPYMVLICLVALSMAILNSHHHFLVPSITPVLLNIVWILILIFVCPLFGESPEKRIYGVAWGILGAGFIQIAFQVPALVKYGFKAKPSLGWSDPKVRQVMLLMGPAVIGMGVFQVNLVLDRALAFLAGTYGPSSINYAERLVYLPLGIFATALGTVLLPAFSRLAAREEQDQIMPTLSIALRNLMFVMVPASIGLLVLAEPIVRLFYERGEFTAESTIFTTRALWFYAPGLIVFSLNKVFVPAFYAMKDVKTPARTGIWVVLLNLVLNITFVLTWRDGYKHAGIAFATVISSAVNAIVLAVLLTRRVGSPNWNAVFASVGKTFMSASAMGVTVYFVHAYAIDVLTQAMTSDLLAQTASLLIAIVSGMCLYLSMSLVVSREEFKAIVKSR